MGLGVAVFAVAIGAGIIIASLAGITATVAGLN